MDPVARYQAALKKIPAPGGNGTHMALFKLGRLGQEAEIPMDQVIKDIRPKIPAGTREVPDHEIVDAVRAAYNAGPTKRQPAPVLVNTGFIAKCIANGRGATVESIRERSPVPLPTDPAAHVCQVLASLYGESEYLFIADDSSPGTLGGTIRTRAEWVDFFSVNGPRFPKLMLNPLTGKPAVKKSGMGETLRGDACISSHRFAVIEHDAMPLEDQLAFWMGYAKAPVVALVHSGKKSIHAWLRVDCVDAAEWKQEVEQVMFEQYFVPLGFDRACKNPSRLTRLPGHARLDTGLRQQCFYLAPQGRAVQG